MFTFELTDGYDRSKNPRRVKVRHMTLEEAKALKYGDHVGIIRRSKHPKLRTVKTNGRVKRWKRQPDRIEIPMKYGMYTYFTITNENLTDLVVEVGCDDHGATPTSEMPTEVEAVESFLADPLRAVMGPGTMDESDFNFIALVSSAGWHDAVQTYWRSRRRV